MATPATQAEAPKRHKVYVGYEEEQDYGPIQVSGYPPPNLEIGDQIVFIPLPPGKLTLTFDKGSNFAGNTIESGPDGKAIGLVTRLMTRAEWKKLQYEEFVEYKDDAVQLEKNAFPFWCKLIPDPKSYGGSSSSKDESSPVEGGFPTRPHVR